MKLGFYILFIIVINEINLLVGDEARETNFSSGYLLKSNTSENYLSVLFLVKSLFQEWNSKKIVIIADENKHLFLLRNLSHYFIQYLPIFHPLNLQGLSFFITKHANENENVLIWCSRTCYTELIIQHHLLNILQHKQKWFIISESVRENEEINLLLKTYLGKNHKGVFIVNLHNGIRIHQLRKVENEVIYNYIGKIPRHCKDSEALSATISLTTQKTLYKKHYSALTYALPPYVKVKNSKIDGGLFYDVLETIAEQLQCKIYYIICSWDQIMYIDKNVTDGDVDIVFPFTIESPSDISIGDHSRAVTEIFNAVVLKNPFHSVKGTFVTDTYLRPLRGIVWVITFLFIFLFGISQLIWIVFKSEMVNNRKPGALELLNVIMFEGEYGRVAKVLQPVLLDWTSDEFKDAMFQEKIAFIAPHLPLIHQFLANNCSFAILPKEYFRILTYFMFPKNSPLTKMVSKYITRLQTSGIMKKLENQYTTLQETCEKITIEPSVGFENSNGMFFILFIGYIIAFITLAIEIYMRKKQI